MKGSMMSNSSMYSSVVRYVAHKGQYSDNSFQLLPSSIFRNQQKGMNKIKWIRLSELFKDRKVTVLRTN